MHRYHRQMLLPGIGEAGQRRLLESHALIVGCGALGSVIIDSLARAGVGTLTIVDRDIVEITNLQRQVLYDEHDVAEGMPKAEAARLRIGRINSEITVHAHVDDFSHRNADRFIEEVGVGGGGGRGHEGRGVDIILDGLDNFETRYLLNDLAVMRGLPYIYGGAVATTGVSMAVLPHVVAGTKRGGGGATSGGATRQVESTRRINWTEAQATPCLRCVFPEAPPPGTSPTCDTAGVLGPVVSAIAAHQTTQALKLLTGNIDAVDRSLLSIDVWTNEFRRFDISSARDEVNNPCPCCVQEKFEHYEGGPGGSSVTTSLCGRNAVQVSPGESARNSMLNLAEIAKRLAAHGTFTQNEYLLRGEFTSERNSKGEPIELTLFPNGRAIIKGVVEPEAGRSIYAKYVGV